MGKGGGGGSPPPAPAPAPSPQETTEQALQAELKYRPQLREADVSDIYAYAQAAAQAERTSGFDLARDEQKLFQELNPESYQTENAVAQQIRNQLGAPITPELESAYSERFRSEEAAAGRLGSPVSSATIARQLVEVGESRRSQALNAGLSFIGRTPLGDPGVPVERGVTGGQFVAPFLQAEQSAYSTRAGIYNTQSNYSLQNKMSKRSSQAQILGSVIGAGGSIAGGFIGACLPKDALVETATGEVPVSKLKVGDEVVGGRVIATFTKARDVDHRFHDHYFESGVVTMTPGHPTDEKILRTEISGNTSPFTYDILTTSGTYKVNGVWLRSTLEAFLPVGRN